MDVLFIGVGEAFDEHLPNTSILIQAYPGHRPVRILLDCGFTAPFSFWRIAPDPLDLDAVWISHFHGDHFLGLPALLLRFHEERRTRPLHLIGQQELEQHALAAMELAYAGVLSRLGYDLVFHPMAPGGALSLMGLSLACARSEHAKPNLALRLDDGQCAAFYSGDGRPTPETLELAKEAQLVIHESFSLDKDVPGHGTVPGSIDFARRAGAPFLALTHVQRDVRHSQRAAVLQHMETAKDLHAHLPLPAMSCASPADQGIPA